MFRPAESPVENPSSHWTSRPPSQTLPARSPPVEAPLESSPPPWRVFDTQPGDTAGATRDTSSDAARAGARLPVLALAGVGAALLVGGLAVVVAIGSVGDAADGPGAIMTAGASAEDVASVGEIVVDVEGAVRSPGVYRLGTAARVRDAIGAAGGFSPRVDTERVARELNLAATLADGVQVRVPSRDDPAGATGGSSPTSGSGPAAGTRINLNSATQAELESLPGIGPVTAGKIIAARSSTPFRTIEELRERGLVGQKTFDSLKALITVG